MAHYCGESQGKVIGTSLLIVLLALAVAPHALAQGMLTSLTWCPSFTAGETRNLIGDATWRPFGIDIKGFMTPQVALGVSFDWRMFDTVTDEIIEIEDGHVSGIQNRRIYATPVLITSSYYFRSFKNYPRYIPYVSGGLGAYWVENKLEIGIYTEQTREWEFGVALELGTLVEFSYGYALLNLKYNHPFASEGQEAVSFLSLGIGIVDTY